jgi:lipoprotein-releasing system permease protein
MGATRGSVLRIFLITGAAIGVVGTLAGFIARCRRRLNIEKIQEPPG